MALDNQKALDDAAFQKQQAENQEHYQQQQAADAKYFADQQAQQTAFDQRKAQDDAAAAKAQDPQNRASEQAANNDIVGGALGMIGMVTGADLMAQLSGVTPLGGLAGGAPDATGSNGVIAGLGDQFGFKVADPAAPAPQQPAPVMNMPAPGK